MELPFRVRNHIELQNEHPGDDLAQLQEIEETFHRLLNYELDFHDIDAHYKFKLVVDNDRHDNYATIRRGTVQVSYRLVIKMDDYHAMRLQVHVESLWFAAIQIIKKQFVPNKVILLDHPIVEAAEFFLEILAIWKHALAYRVQNKYFFNIPSAVYLSLPVQRLIKSKTAIENTIRRVYWLQARQRSGQELYSRPARDRYRVEGVSVEMMLQSMEPKHSKMFTDLSSLVTWEWWTFLLLVNYSTLARLDWEKVIGENIHDYREIYGIQDNSGIPDFNQIAKPCSILEAVLRHEDRCCVCYFKYTLEYSDARMTEPAVKTPCDHIIGQECFRKWVEEGNGTCPFCRQPFFPLEKKLPAQIRPFAEDVTRLTAEQGAFDEALDTFLLAGFHGVHDKDFGELLERLAVQAEAIFQFALEKNKFDVSRGFDEVWQFSSY